MYDKKIRNLTMHGAKSLAFECFAAELFRSNNYTVISEYNIDNKYVDIVLFRNDIMDYVCEIKYFSNIDVSPYILKKAVCQLQTVSLNSSKKMLIINSICDNNTKKNIFEETGVLIFDLRNILYYVDIESNLYRDLLGILEFSISDVEPEETIVDLIKSNIKIKKELKKMDWSNKFAVVRKGKKSFRQYEELCVEALKLVLSDYLDIWEQQQNSSDDLFRFDLICKIKKNIDDDFFTTLNKYFNTKYVVFEFKNYNEKITLREINTTEKYLYDKALRNVAIIVSREGVSENADKAIKGSLREQGKLIISLTDFDLLDMIDMYYNCDNATDFLASKLDKLLIELEK